MSVTNVGRLERRFRLLLVALILVVSAGAIVAHPSRITVVAGFVGSLSAGLLVRSVRSGYCPIHERAGVDTTRD